jgi:hypothetical protein
VECGVLSLLRTLREGISLGRGRNFSPLSTARYGRCRRYGAGVAAHLCETDVAQAYVVLTLRLRRLVPALVAPIAVDPATFGAVGNEPPPTAAELVRQAGRIAAALPGAGLAPDRERFLVGQLAALEWRARGLAGQRVPFRHEVRECLGLTVAPGEPDDYRAAHRELAALLPGSGPVGDRLVAYRHRDAVPPDRLGSAVRALSAALRDRTADWCGPVGIVEYRLVDGAPWSALQTYVGEHRSVVRVGVGVGAARLPRLVAHEAYPGHHIECRRAAASVVAGRVELGVTLLGSPQTVVSEGLAECGLGTAVGPGWGPWAAGVLATAGVSLDGELAERLDPVLTVLRRVRLDAALLLHDDGPPTSARIAAAEEHLRRWLLLDAVRARRVVAALARPLWRTQVVASVGGEATVRAVLERAPDRVAEHGRLLDAAVLLDALRSRTSTYSRQLFDGR